MTKILQGGDGECSSTYSALNPGLLLTAYVILDKLTSQISVFSFVN